mmetsp:Transcript_1312/g.2058  ORF Transcript_1312/g.2058 Transcript_1312/m.2058 type:complete len:448 (-) Transcript_1312:49-1392(-)|eukprot:CAMPEP_0203744184 /NCGR_PEP_ID=MMETSP0098-20131031/346_1 /ASSEMBLY_ACC=CAM_ASM_000208 /TAXON_ID=96639 /ORGANISM=" , Strain NY0313808BC1" /LENGTH=447 /DNA_ID=CAMNT_0050631639 /DNA_START=226 /DNA_END=1569 /DNA_ORIENTATION=+
MARLLCFYALTCAALSRAAQGVSTHHNQAGQLRASILEKLDATATSSGPVWSLQGKNLLKDGNKFFIKGLDYQPVPVGGGDFALQTVGWGNLGDYTNDLWENIYKRDLVNLRDMGVNVVKSYFFWRCAPQKDTAIATSLANCKEYLKTNPGITHKNFLDALWNNGIDPIFIIIPVAVDLGNTLANGDPATGQAYQEFYQWVAKDLMQTYGNHPAVLGVMIGNELNQKKLVKTTAYWDALGKIADAAVDGFKLAGVNEPKKSRIISSALQGDINFGTYKVPNGTAIESYQKIFNVFTYNAYEGCGVLNTDSVFGVYPNLLKMPILLGEWGTPNSNSGGQPGNNAQAAADHITCYWTDHISKHSDVGIGAFYFEYSDEWWKLGEPVVQNLNSINSNPLWIEEAFGLYSIKNANRPAKNPWNQTGNKPYPCDILSPYPGVQTFKALRKPF